MTDFWDIAGALIQIPVTLVLLFRALRTVRTSRGAQSVALYSFVLLALLVSNVYWIALMLLRPGERPYFMPSEIADDGVLLLIGAAAAAAIRQRKGKLLLAETLAAVLFSAANVALWIGWTGEWVKDLIGAAPFSYMVVAVVRNLKTTDALRKGEWYALGLACLVLIAAQVAIFFVPEPQGKGLDVFCYVLMFCGIAAFYVRTGFLFRQGAPADILLSTAFGGFAWSIISMYMCPDPMWTFADLAVTGMLVAILLALERQVKAE